MTVLPFYSVNQEKKPQHQRVYHNNNKCASGYDIPQHERKKGAVGRLCQHCRDLNAKT
jgi:hypothetical protein